jgi:hypothetical protein
MRTWEQVEAGVAEAKAPKLSNMATVITAALDGMVTGVVNRLPNRLKEKGKILGFADDALKVEASGEGTSKGDLPLSWYVVAWWSHDSRDGRMTLVVTVPDRDKVEKKYDLGLDADLGKPVDQIVALLSEM